MSDFLQSINTTDWVITPNNRLSQSLQQRYALLQESSVFALPTFLPYDALLQLLFEKVLRQSPLKSNSIPSHPLLLSNIQLQVLISELTQKKSNIVRNEALTARIIDSYKRCYNWEVAIQLPLFAYNHQTELFCHWITKIERALLEMDAICMPQLAAYLMKHTINLEGVCLYWYGFDDFTPQQRSLHTWFESQGVRNIFCDIDSAASPMQVYAAKNEQDEQQQWLQWLLKHKNGNKKLGVILPDLANQADAIARLMARYFPADAFNISLGQSLMSYPLAAQALILLALTHDNPLESKHIKILLHSAFLGESQTELHGRSLLLNEQALMQHRQLSLSGFIQRCQSAAPLLSKRLKNISSYPSSASPFEWAQCFDTRLQQMGFPGELALNSASYQCYQRFTKALNEFRTLSLIRPTVDFQEALHLLQAVLQQIIFQPQASATAYIHITGVLEASGNAYDGLWIAGLSDHTLPQALQYSPFIPVPLQQQKKMPHASLEREQALAQIMIDRFQRATPELICSYPSLLADRPCLPSPFISNAIACDAINDMKTFSPSVEYWEESYLIPLDADEKIQGGSSLLANQAKCPFRALSAHRLHCDSLSYEQDGIEKRDQGILIHQIMEQLWHEIKSQKNLLQWPTSKVQALIERICDTALLPYQPKDHDLLLEHTLKVERSRLIQLALASLEEDKSRPPFEVCAIETQGSYNVGSHVLRIKIDRLDIEPSGKKWLIDYKSSIPRIPWDKDRPEDPQLILYAMQDKDITTISYLQLKSGDIGYKGLSYQKSDIDGISAPKKGLTWEHYQKNWGQALQTLIDEFSQGHCAPEPLRNDICTHCDFGSLCRFTMREKEDS